MLFRSVKADRHSKHSRARNEQPVEAESCSENFATDSSKHDSASIIDTIDRRVVQLECANDVSSPGSDSCDKYEDNNSRSHAQSVEGCRNREHTQTNL